MKGQKIQVGQQAFAFILNKSPEKLRLLSYCPADRSCIAKLTPASKALYPSGLHSSPLFRKKREAVPSPRLGALICENRCRVGVGDQWADILCQSSGLSFCALCHLPTSQECSKPEVFHRIKTAHEESNYHEVHKLLLPPVPLQEVSPCNTAGQHGGSALVCLHPSLSCPLPSLLPFCAHGFSPRGQAQINMGTQVSPFQNLPFGSFSLQ